MVQTMGTTGFYSQICKHFLYIFVKKVGDSDLVLLGKTWSSKMDELPVAAAHDSNCLKVPQGYKKGNGSFRSYSRSDPGSFRSYSRSDPGSFRPGSFRPDFRGGSFRPNFGVSFRPTLFYIVFR